MYKIELYYDPCDDEDIYWSNDQIIGLQFLIYLNSNRINLENNYNIMEIINWCNTNCLDNYGFDNHGRWYFLNESDSIQFSLRWL